MQITTRRDRRIARREALAMQRLSHKQGIKSRLIDLHFRPASPPYRHRFKPCRSIDEIARFQDYCEETAWHDSVFFMGKAIDDSVFLVPVMDMPYEDIALH